MGTKTHHTHLTIRTIRTIVAFAAAVALLGIGGGAQARQDAGTPVATDLDPVCGLARVDHQFVACDNLTGNGVAAPLWIPELR